MVTTVICLPIRVDRENKQKWELQLRSYIFCKNATRQSGTTLQT